ncbi:GtrA family protein [Cellulosilyticum lentocellum]|uniref:GtrA family protein n=1 Tax=Cellulosilyticum lentocellum (strain ATCC 49066 / DSM 5427 / NCIMB 11756 / RHM5) TaxID=642492 RepID=F2JIK1_CELLD|nr:GtrA family protein [Cellulosilyticum lentocellum]ADZ85471.1 GtrA family protein [Cellulosilyticum lentocellum DSM 5427]
MQQFKIFISKYNTIIQFVKFGIVGLSNTLISLAAYYILIYIGVNYIMANAIGFVLGTINAYYWNNKYVFKKTQEGNIKPFLKSFTGYGMTFLLGTICLVLLVQVLGVSEFIAPIINMLITIPINFFINKFWAFK